MQHETHFRPTRAIVDLDAIRTNLQRAAAHVKEGTKVIAVVKADGYGHGEAEVARAALEAGAFMAAVATPDEAVQLRVSGITEDVLVMGPSPAHFAETAAGQNIIVTAPSLAWLKKAAAYAKGPLPLRVHVKIDSGMGRVGVRDLPSLLELLTFAEQTPAVSVEGLFTHFACADEEDPSATENQFRLFKEMTDAAGKEKYLIHASNSAATLLYTDYAFDAVRFGISLYGIAPSAFVGGRLPFELKRAMTIETEIAFVKKVEKGSRISYGGTYTAAGDEWIATLPVGYADGLKRGLREQEVLVRGKRVPIVGTICMDQCMIRLDEEMPAGEKVTLIGPDGGEEITMEEWAERTGTIPYEIAVTVGSRIPRIYKGSRG